MTKFHYIVRVSSAPTKGRFGSYGRVAILRVPVDVTEVAAIRDVPSRGIKVVECTDRLYWGGERSALRVAERELRARAAELNAELASAAVA